MTVDGMGVRASFLTFATDRASKQKSFVDKE